MNMSALQQPHCDTEPAANENEFGETPLPFAPAVKAASGEQVIPQQYLDVNRTLESVEAILTLISLPKDYVLFAGQDNNTVYLMCGVIGQENYSANLADPKNAKQPKIVYGRRWLLEPSTPTSEVVQTALLAVKKVREHELREHFRLSIEVPNTDRVGIATPFNCHIDLPLLAAEMAEKTAEKNRALTLVGEPDNDLGSQQIEQTEKVEQVLSRVSVSGLRPILQSTHRIDDRTLYLIGFEKSDSLATSLVELIGRKVSVVCETNQQNEFLHELFNAILKLSDRFIEEAFEFRGFARFSQQICPADIAQFSYRTRKTVNDNAQFTEAFADMSYRVDAAKAPAFNAGKLGQQQREALNQYGLLAGYLPS